MAKKARPIAAITLLYLLTHLPGLTKLPVFADEAIYIRWTQLIMDEPVRYFFFALNDGKTPLQIWLTLPFQYLFADPLFAARFFVLSIGLLQVAVMAMTSKALDANKRGQFLAATLTCVLPFWYFHHRVALLDGLMTLFLSLAFFSSLKLRLLMKKKIDRKIIFWTIASGVSLGLALLSKPAALLFLPIIVLSIFWPKEKTVEQYRKTFISKTLAMTFGTAIGMGMLFSLKVSAAFPQLFARGSDFLFPFGEVLLQGKWQETLPNFPTYLAYFITYLGLPVLLAYIFGILFSKKYKSELGLLLASGFLFFLPILLFGRVVYPRYFLAVSIFMTLSFSLLFDELLAFVEKSKNLRNKTALALLATLLLVASLQPGINFIFYSLTNIKTIPFVSADEQQYLAEWSAGFGVKEVTDYLLQESQTKSIAVATEGSFGTLPDGVNMYLHRQSVENLYVEGIGWPVKSLTKKFYDRASDYEKVYLLVNEHRIEIPEFDNEPIQEYCRRPGDPCMQLFDITSDLNNIPIKTD